MVGSGAWACAAVRMVAQSTAEVNPGYWGYCWVLIICHILDACVIITLQMVAQIAADVVAGFDFATRVPATFLPFICSIPAMFGKD